MTDLLTVVYVIGFFLLFVAPMVYLAWDSVDSEVHSPSAGESVEAGE